MGTGKTKRTNKHVKLNTENNYVNNNVKVNVDDASLINEANFYSTQPMQVKTVDENEPTTQSRLGAIKKDNLKKDPDK